MDTFLSEKPYLQPANIRTKVFPLKESECILKPADWNVICLTCSQC